MAIGDPQAPFDTFLEVLRHRGVIDAAGHLAPHTHLVSLGDHFDFGGPGDRDQATRDGVRIVEWLASHPAEQVTLLLGNHDLARVCELSGFSDDEFYAARTEAEVLYRSGAALGDFLTRYPAVPDAECVARDFSCFSVAQRTLVTRLLRERRFRLAAAFEGCLFVHAGLTAPYLRLLKVAPTAPAEVIARALNAFLDERVDAWREGPLNLEPLHVAGHSHTGEGRGLLYHRPADPQRDTEPGRFTPVPSRRYDPRALPLNLQQVIGHISDAKCRELMPGWAIDDASPGAIRSLHIEGSTVRYRTGVQPGAQLIFCDGAMGRIAPSAYQVFTVAKPQV